MKSVAFLASRLLNALYFVASCVYCLLAHSAFANEQFLRPQLIGWLPGVVAQHHMAYWATVLITLPTLVPTLRLGTSRYRTVAGIYAGFSLALGGWLASNPVLAFVGPDTRTLTVALICLLPPLALAVVDHVGASSPAVRRMDERRLFLGIATTAILVWLSYVVLVPWHIARMPGISLDPAGLALAIGISLASHLSLFAIGFVTLGAALAVAALTRRPLVEYWTMAALIAMGLALVFQRVVAAALSFDPAETWILSLGLGVVLVGTWSGVVWHHAGGGATREVDAFELWFSPITHGTPALAIGGILALPLVALGLRTSVAQFDWNFLLQKLGVCLVWIGALGLASRVARADSRFAMMNSTTRWLGAAIVIAVGLAGVPAAARLSAASGGARLDPDFVLDRYAALDGSYQLVSDLLTSPSGEHAAFYTFLKAHSTLGRVPAAPFEVNFVDAFTREGRPPHVFLFIVDSLRRDYLSPYNPKVAFTPATQAFAGESIVFERAFTRYGSTGLSVPSLWTGGMLLHKQYVTPFAPMNALEKLLDGVGYRRFLSDDHLVTGLFRPSPDTTLLDGAIQEMDHALCTSTQELQSRLDATHDDPRPVFAMTRPLQLHMARLVRNPPVNPSAYPGFVPGYAAQVAALDRCLGEFIDYLKRRDLYDQSVVVLTADHGESLGEDGRWGHAVTLYPELVQIPLIVHLPAAAAADLTTDRSQVALSTDITPTLYALAGQSPRDLGVLYGTPLFVGRGQAIPSRRRASFLLSSSYGPGYAMLRHNGRELYIADAVQGRDFAYEMSPDGELSRVTVTNTMRAVNRTLIQEHISQIAADYNFSPSP